MLHGRNQKIAPKQPTPLLWGAYVGDNLEDLALFEKKVGKPVDILSVFYKFGDDFPILYAKDIGEKGKILLLFWEPEFSYDNINDGSKDEYIKKFVADANIYGYPVILAPFPEMNGNWDVWGGTMAGNTPLKFIDAWKHIHDLFIDAPNVKFAIVYNNNSSPPVLGNQFNDYYPGELYVDYVGIDGFNFGYPWLSFESIFSSSVAKLSVYKKPLYIFSMGSVPGEQKAAWITDALGIQIHTYPISGWVWFNQNGLDGNWLIDSDPASLAAFKRVIP